MYDYCLDADSLIQSKNGPYGFGFALPFWDWLSEKIAQKIIFAPKMVCKELTDGNDRLAEWAKEQKQFGFAVEPNEEDQKIYSEIANYVAQRYPIATVEDYLSKGDPWLVAQAKTRNSIVVTHEKLVRDNSRKIKIPNICNLHGVSSINIYQLIPKLDAKFVGMK